MTQRVNLVGRTGMNQGISRLMDHFGIRYTSHILDEVTLLQLQHFQKVNSPMNVNGTPNNPDNPDNPERVRFRRVNFVREPEVSEEKETSIAQEIVVEEQIKINPRTKTETKTNQTRTRTTIVITKTTFKE